MANGKENMDIRVHRARRKFLDLDRRQRLSRLLLLRLRSGHHRCPVDLACTRQVPHHHMVPLHSRRQLRALGEWDPGAQMGQDPMGSQPQPTTTKDTKCRNQGAEQLVEKLVE